MPIGSAKIGVLGAGLVPGGSQTFNASGTFTVPPGVKKVNITGKGGTGNPGNAGNAGNPGNPGTGGAGGGAGGVFPGCGTPGWSQYQAQSGGRAYKGSPFSCPNAVKQGSQGNGNTPYSSPPGIGANPGNAGCSGIAGNAGTAGNAGNPGNPGCASTGLSKTFNGGAGGNAGAAGAAGNGGGAGPGGGGGGGASFNQLPTGNYPTAPGGSAGTGGGSGGPGRPANAPVPPAGSPGTVFTAGSGGGGAGTTNSGENGTAGTTFSPGFLPFSNKCAFNVCVVRKGGNYPLVSGPLPNNGGTTPTFNPNMVGGPSGVATPPSAVFQAMDSITLAQGSPPANVNRTSFCSFSGNCKPGILRAGGGGGLGGIMTTNMPCGARNSAPSIRTGGGGAGGARGGAGNAGGNSTGGAGSAGTPSTFNCVPVTPGSPYPIVVGGPSGGQVVISWNPQ